MDVGLLPSMDLRLFRKTGYWFNNLMYVLLFSLVTIGVWVSFSIFLSQKKTPIDPELIRLSLPLNPNINLEVIKDLATKKSYSASELEGFTIYTLITDKQTRQRILVSLDEYQQIQLQEEQKKLAPPAILLEPDLGESTQSGESTISGIPTES